MANRQYNTAVDIGKRLGAELANASAAFDAGQLQAVREMTASIEELGATLQDKFTDFAHWWRVTYVAYATFMGLLALVFTISAIKHYKVLQAAIRALKEQQSSTGSVKALGGQLDSLIWSYRSLLFTTFITLALSVSYFPILVFVAVRAREVASGTHLTEVVLYFYAGFGTLSSVVILVRSVFEDPDGGDWELEKSELS
ncbi:hypothetical protein RQP46_003587 [Phenoliferia psychrophenolica]